MSGNSMFSPTMDVLTKSLTFLEQRHRIIADNIANINTPFFKAKEAPLDEFRKSLADALRAAGKTGASALTLRSTEHVRFGPDGMAVTPVEANAPDAVLRHDQNNVSLEREMAALAENTLLYRTLSDLLRKQFMMLQTAVKERVE